MCSSNEILWNHQYPLGSIGTREQSVGVVGGGSDASVYSVNWCCNFLMRVVFAQSSVVSVAFVVDKAPTDWWSAVVMVEMFANDW